jgi:hypothetical protein
MITATMALLKNVTFISIQGFKYKLSKVTHYVKQLTFAYDIPNGSWNYNYLCNLPITTDVEGFTPARGEVYNIM